MKDDPAKNASAAQNEQPWRRKLGYVWCARRIVGIAALVEFVATSYVAGGTNPDPNPVEVHALLATFAALLITRFLLGRYLRREERNGRPLTIELAPPSDQSTNHGLSEAETFALVKLESELLQSRFDKYDSLVFQLRGWLMTLGLAAASAYVVVQSHPRGIVWLTAILAGGFWLLEYRWRQDWHKFVQRYKFIRESLHANTRPRLESPLDLTDHYQRRKRLALYEQAYGEGIGPMIEKQFRGADQTLPLSTLSEMSIFYVVIIGSLVAFPAFAKLL